jgi:predicted MFS family arabinose efflux permease
MLGVMAILVYNVGSMWGSIGLALVWCYLASFGYVSGDRLTIDQVPDYRGTLMSLNTVSRSIGAMIGAMIGGYALLNSNYGWFGLVLGVMGIIASLIYGLLSKEARIQRDRTD